MRDVPSGGGGNCATSIVSLLTAGPPTARGRSYFHQSRILGTEVVFGCGSRVVGADLATGRITLDQSGWDATTTLGLTLYDMVTIWS